MCPFISGAGCQMCLGVSEYTCQGGALVSSARPILLAVAANKQSCTCRGRSQLAACSHAEHTIVSRHSNTEQSHHGHEHRLQAMLPLHLMHS